jgi:hypothetical protein
MQSISSTFHKQFYHFGNTKPPVTSGDDAHGQKLLPNQDDNKILTTSYHVPAISKATWLFPRPSSKIPKKCIDNVVHYAAINPRWDVAFLTNDVKKLRDALPTDIPQNLRVELCTNSKALDAFPKTQKLAKGILRYHAAIAKDYYNCADIKKFRGVRFDPDTKFHEPMPFPLYIEKPIAVHKSCENSVMAYADSPDDVFGELLEHTEDQIPKVLKYDDSDDKATYMTYDKTACVEKIADELHFTRYTELMREHADDLQKYINYTTPPSTYGNGDKFPSLIRCAKSELLA